ncbi:MAG: MarR family winged helix-turn-helix transcriptional regulator [Mycobacterium leprae]
MPNPSDLERSAQAIMETVPQVMRFIRTEMRQSSAHALSVPQFRALAYLNRHPGASLTDVADHLGITRAAGSTLIDRLVQGGWVNRVPDPAERRRVILTLTAEGAGLLQQARTVTRNQVIASLAHLSDAQLQTVTDGIALLETVFRQAAARDSHEK